MKVALLTFTSNLFNFGIRSIEAYLRRSGHDVFTVNCSTRHNKIGFLSDNQLKILAGKCGDCDVIGISVVSYHNFNKTKQVTNYLKQNIRAKVVLGGVPVIIDPDEYLQFADYVCLGEGEIFFKHFLENDNNSQIPGLGYKSADGQIVKNPLLPLVDVNELPMPYFDFDNTYILTDEVENPIRSLAQEPDLLKNSCSNFGYRLITIRGCLFSCTFCGNNKLNSVYRGKGRIVRALHNKRIIEELEYAKKIVSDLKQVTFFEDDFAARSLDVFENLIKEYQERIGLPIYIWATPSKLSDEKIDILARYGVKVRSISMGLQSASNRVLKDVYKRGGFNKERYLDKIETVLSKIDIKELNLNIILQNPYENVYDYIANLEFYYELGQRLSKKNLPGKTVYLSRAPLQFYPGTEIYDMALRDGFIDKDYKEKVLLSMGKYSTEDEHNPYAMNKLSIDLLLLSLYFLLINNKIGPMFFNIIKMPFVLITLEKLFSTELLRKMYKYFKNVPILVKGYILK